MHYRIVFGPCTILLLPEGNSRGRLPATQHAPGRGHYLHLPTRNGRACASSSSRAMDDRTKSKERPFHATPVELLDTAAPYHAQHSTAQHGTANHSTAPHRTAPHSTAQHSTAQQTQTQHSQSTSTAPAFRKILPPGLLSVSGAVACPSVCTA